MRNKNIELAIKEAEDFINLATKLITVRNGRDHSWENPRESGALRRSSMELTRALAEMRKP